MYEQRLPIEEWKSQKQKERNDKIAAAIKIKGSFALVFFILFFSSGEFCIKSCFQVKQC